MRAWAEAKIAYLHIKTSERGGRVYESKARATEVSFDLSVPRSPTRLGGTNGTLGLGSPLRINKIMNKKVGWGGGGVR